MSKSAEAKKADRDQRKAKNAHLWKRDPDDYYIENRWVDEALFATVPFIGAIIDPACGSGRILDAAAAAGHRVLGMDIHDRGASARHPFLKANFITGTESKGPWQNIVSNPPYLYGEEFMRLAVERSMDKTALLLNMQWANAGRRSRWLETLPLRYVLAISPRPSMPPGRVIEAGVQAGGGKTDFAWYITERSYTGRPEFGWVHRQKKIE